MTSEIDLKRKELEDEARILELEHETRHHTKLEGFNLGVSLAQKEFLELLESKKDWGVGRLNQRSAEAIVKLIEELKKAVGNEPTTS